MMPPKNMVHTHKACPSSYLSAVLLPLRIQITIRWKDTSGGIAVLCYYRRALQRPNLNVRYKLERIK